MKVTLIKDGKTATVASVDAQAWINDGWQRIGDDAKPIARPPKALDTLKVLLYKGNESEYVPAIDVDARLADGWTRERVEPKPVEDTEQPDDWLPDFAAMVNIAKTARSLTPIPGVGIKTAEGLLANRPEGGYISWNQMVKANADLNRVPWDELREWEREWETD